MNGQAAEPAKLRSPANVHVTASSSEMLTSAFLFTHWHDWLRLHQADLADASSRINVVHLGDMHIVEGWLAHGRGMAYKWCRGSLHNKQLTADACTA